MKKNCIFFVYMVILSFFVLTLTPSYAQDYDAYLFPQWHDIKIRIIPELLKKLQDSLFPRSILQQYYYQKYPREEREIVKLAVSQILPNYSLDEQEQAVREILSFHHVVYHETLWHRMDKNVSVCKTYETLIEKYSTQYGVPSADVKAIICWENSGGTTNVSYAACAGLGQLSWGAVEKAHRYGMEMTEYNKAKAKACSMLYKYTGKEIYRQAASSHLKEAEFYNIAKRHKKLAKDYGVKDERLIPECNIEDTVVFYKIMREYYDGRSDLAIASYHNGVSNMDELLTYYIERELPWMLKDSQGERGQLLDVMKKYGINYLSLWNDNRSREMLSGYRTMDCEITNDANKDQALGDESDIYLWKVIASYGALCSPYEELMSRINLYRSRWDVVECRGLKVYSNLEDIKRAINEEKLVHLPQVYKDCGIGAIPSPDLEYEKKEKKFNYFATPELAGFIYKLSSDLKGATGIKSTIIPIKACLQSKLIKTVGDGCKELESGGLRTHLQGVAIDCNVNESPVSSVLYSLIKWYYLMDRIYLIYEDSHYHICLNPRYGSEFYQYYNEFKVKLQAK